MTTPSRWHRFSVIYAWGLLFLAPCWVATIVDKDSQLSVAREAGDPLWPAVLVWSLLGTAALAPVAQIIVAFRLYRPQRAFYRIGAAAGAAVVFVLSFLLFVTPVAGVLACLGPLLTGAALGQLGASALPISVPRVRRGACLASSLGGGVAGVFLFVLFIDWAMDHIWTDSLNAIPYGLSLWALAATAAFLVWWLGREAGR